MVQMTEDEFLNRSTWYHATSINAVESIKRKIDVRINRKGTLDFGYGFYLCPSIEWAKKYAQSFKDGDECVGAILQYEFKPIDLIDTRTKYKFFGRLDNEFAEFVFRNRQYSKYHIFTHCVHNYDIVMGVMSDGNQFADFLEYNNKQISKEELFRRLLVPKEDWQLTLHRQRLCKGLYPSKTLDWKGDVLDE